MTPAFPTRRRADEFEALLSRDAGRELTEREARQYAPLLDVVADLRDVPPVEPRPEFVAALRERLMAEADTVLAGPPAAPERLAMPAPSRTRRRTVGALLGGAALVGSAATMAVAAQSALPGESLYGVKRGIESAQVRLADDDAGRGRALLAQARTRLAEVEELAAGDAAGRDRLVPDTLDAFTDQSSEGVRSLLSAYEDTGSDRDAQLARDFTVTSMERLERLDGELPASARDALLAAGRTLADLDLEVSTTCRGCAGGITTTPEFLLTSTLDDLVAGLDVDDLSLEGAPISGQDLTGIRVPEALDPQQGVPTPGPSTSVRPTPTPSLPVPTGTVPTGTDPTTPEPTKPEPTRPVKDPTDGIPDPLTDTTDSLTDTTGALTGQLDDATGGALGGLTSGVDDATGGLIGEVTGTLDGLTGGTLGNATGGLLP
ncbi:DUF5667 domain-containing protein [Nocardioides sp. zg-1228]|uniref:DUF5667 domain-containing protein n=1 Tax=Nocardioides sp. zg-1228 TaxID=2763008 RepID=UPI001642435D|nr:DUF5667 domain-containing protein [Nocardioides sp. zg-1228]MBC2932650.1 hypothetical protein [Nocardioides sp. zg-1228]QSF58134.1 hypothetical protein JX575_02650 [Nocardioides sp. zg-1228]